MRGFFTYCCSLQLHATLRDPLLNQAIQFKNIWWHPFKKKYGTKRSSCSEYTTDSIKYFVLVLKRVRTVYRRNDIAVRTLMSTTTNCEQFSSSSTACVLYTGSVLFCEQKWTWILVSFVQGKRFIHESRLPEILWTLVLNAFLSINSLQSNYSLFIYIYPHGLIAALYSVFYQPFLLLYSTVQRYSAGTLLIL
jgi:hypothetical protein